MSRLERHEILELKIKAENIRKRVIEIIYSSKSGHIGGSLSSIDIETALYFHVMNVDPKNPEKPDRDRFILSKGHSVEALYAVLSAAGFFDDDILNTYGEFNSILEGHPSNKIPGIEVNSGSLGHGLSVGIGMAIASKMDNNPYRVFVLMGDGEQAEGSIYEAAISAGHYKIENLVAIIDRNGLQISGKTEEVMTLEPLRDRWESFGWQVIEMKGNEIESIVKTFDNLEYHNDKPKLIIANTTKGSGISFMEKNAKWHHGTPNEEQYIEAKHEINARIENLKKQLFEHENK